MIWWLIFVFFFLWCLDLFGSVVPDVCSFSHPWNLILGGDQTVEKAVVLSDADHPAMVLLRTESGYTTNAAIQDAAASYRLYRLDLKAMWGVRVSEKRVIFQNISRIFWLAFMIFMIFMIFMMFRIFMIFMTLWSHLCPCGGPNQILKQCLGASHSGPRPAKRKAWTWYGRCAARPEWLGQLGTFQRRMVKDVALRLASGDLTWKMDEHGLFIDGLWWFAY